MPYNVLLRSYIFCVKFVYLHIIEYNGKWYDIIYQFSNLQNNIGYILYYIWLFCNDINYVILWYTTLVNKKVI